MRSEVRDYYLQKYPEAWIHAMVAELSCKSSLHLSRFGFGTLWLR